MEKSNEEIIYNLKTKGTLSVTYRGNVSPHTSVSDVTPPHIHIGRISPHTKVSNFKR